MVNLAQHKTIITAFADEIRPINTSRTGTTIIAMKTSPNMDVMPLPELSLLAHILKRIKIPPGQTGRKIAFTTSFLLLLEISSPWVKPNLSPEDPSALDLPATRMRNG
jgi:hypothetical protein